MNTTQSPHQSAAAAVAQPVNGNGNGNGNGSGPGSNEAESSLTPTELREKEYRRQQRETAERERQRQAIELLERKHAAQQAAQQEAKQRQRQEIEAREAAAQQANAARPTKEEKRRNDSRVAEPEARNLDQRPSGRTWSRGESTNRRVGGDLDESSRRPSILDRKKSDLEHRRVTPRQYDQRPQQESRTNPPRARRIGMPDFGSGSNGQQTQESSNVGWGSGSAEIKPIEYAEQQQRIVRREESRAQEFLQDNFTPQGSQQKTDPVADIFPGFNINTGRDRRFQSGGYRNRGPSRNQDSFWSSPQMTEPPPPPPSRPSNVFGSNDFGGTGYRASPFDPADGYKSSTHRNDAADVGQSGTWSHLRQRGAIFEPPPQVPQSYTQRQPFQQRQERRTHYPQSQDEIDRNFRSYQDQRVQYGPRIRRPEDNVRSYDPFAQKDQEDPALMANRKCARCHQRGHPARECTAPIEQVKAKCHYCGDFGHMEVECLVKRTRRGPVRTVGAPPQSSPFDSTTQPRESMEQSSRLFERTTRPQESLEQDIQPEWRDTGMKRPEMAAEETAELSERRARWSKRGFEVEEEPVQPSSELRERRRSRRSIERKDDEAADEANALREERAARKSARKNARRHAAESADNQPTTLTLPEFISVSQLAQVLGIRYERLLKRLEQEGYDDVFPGKILNMETSGMIAMEYNFEPKFEYDSAVAREERERDLKPRPELVDKSLLPTRPPVVTIMGHVDHGKTTILDFLRKSSVAAGEAGGITQHIGAFSVPMSSSGRTITFLDTPGHAAFLAMRQRGANVTDVVVLVVAADDSVKPQTLESLRCAREAGVPILVAINKVDKDGADVQRVKQDLAKHGVEIEDFGGDVQTVCLSGKTGEGMADFEEAIATLSEILDHRAETDGDVEGWVLEATTKSQGRVATVLVKRGTLRVGQIIVAGKTWARVRSLKNENGQTLNSVGPGMPVEVDGWREQAVAGDQVLQAPNEQKASAVVEYRTEISEREKMSEDMEAINEARRLEQEKRAKEKAAEEAEKRGENSPSDEAPTALPDQQAQNASTGQITIPFIIKSDVSGSAEAVAAYIPSLTSPLIAPEILSSDVGPVNESDVEYASTVQGHIIAFNLPQNSEALGMAESKGVKILENDVIYRILDQVKEVLEDKLPPIVTQRVLGEAEVAAGFEIGVKGRKKMNIAGCKVRNGVVSMKTRARVLRGGVGGERVYDGELRAFPRYDRVESFTNCLSRCHYLPEEREERRARDA